MGLFSLMWKESLVLVHFCATVLTFVIALVVNFGQQATTNVPYLGIGSAIVFVLLLAAHLPLDRLCGYDK